MQNQTIIIIVLTVIVSLSVTLSAILFNRHVALRDKTRGWLTEISNCRNALREQEANEKKYRLKNQHAAAVLYGATPLRFDADGDVDLLLGALNSRRAESEFSPRDKFAIKAALRMVCKCMTDRNSPVRKQMEDILARIET